MHLPGEQAVFSQLHLDFSPPPVAAELPLAYQARVQELDERFDLLQVAAELRRGNTHCAKAELSAFVRRDSPHVSIRDLIAHLPESAALQGKTALVVGGSRGLGAALVTALASQGCRVLCWNYHASRE